MEGEKQPKLLAQAFIKLFNMRAIQDDWPAESKWFKEAIGSLGKVNEGSFLFQKFFTKDTETVLILWQDAWLQFSNPCGSTWT